MQISDAVVWRGEEQTHVSGNLIQGAWPEGQEPKFQEGSSANWRGYLATWLVDDTDLLRLASITGKIEGDDAQGERDERLRKILERASAEGTLNEEDSLELFSSGSTQQLYRLFPGHDGPVLATWFTGELMTGYGDLVEWGYFPVYEHYVVFQVEQGKVVKIEEHDSEWWYKQNTNGGFRISKPTKSYIPAKDKL